METEADFFNTIGQEQSFEIYPLSRRPLPAPSFLVRITLSNPDKVKRKTHFLSPEIKTRPSHFVLLGVAPEVHLKASTVPIRDGDMKTPRSIRPMSESLKNFQRDFKTLSQSGIPTALTTECLSATVLITFKKKREKTWFESKTIEPFSAIAKKRLVISGAHIGQEDFIVS